MINKWHTFCHILKVFNMVALGCVSNNTNSCMDILLHTSVLLGSSEILGKDRGGPLLWMALYMTTGDRESALLCHFVMHLLTQILRHNF